MTRHGMHRLRPMQLLRFQMFAPQFSLRTCHNLKARAAELWTKIIVQCCNTRSFDQEVGRRYRLSPNKTYKVHFFLTKKKCIRCFSHLSGCFVVSSTMNTRELHCIELMQRINTSSSSGFQPGVVTLWWLWTILRGVVSRYIMYTNALHFL